MSTAVSFNGTTYDIPTTGETDWGNQLTGFLVDVGTVANIKKEQIQNTRTVVADYTLTATDFAVFVNGTTAIALTLPSASVGQIYVIRDVSGSASTLNITITPTLGQTIDGLTNKVISTNNGGCIIQFAGSNTWRVINESFGTASAVSNLTVSGQATVGYLQLTNIVTVTGAATLLATTSLVRIASSTGSFALLLPASYTVGSELTIKDCDGSLAKGGVTITTQGSHLIDGNTTLVMSQSRASVKLSYTAANEWSIL